MQIVDRERVVRILDEKRGGIENNQRKDHLLEWNPIHGDAVFGKMRGRIHMRAVLSDHLVICAAKSVLGDGVGLPRLGIDGRRHPCLTEARPHGRVGTETVGQIDKFFTRDDPIRAPKLCLCLRGRDKTISDRGSRKHAQTTTGEPRMTHPSLRRHSEQKLTINPR